MPNVDSAPRFDSAAPLHVVINGEAGRSDTEATRGSIETALRESGRRARVHLAGPGELAHVSRAATADAQRDASAVIAVGGDGTINTVAQAAHACACPMGVIAEGTFNFFAREHGAPTNIADAVRWLLTARIEPVQAAAVNDQLFLVNASVGLYPELLQDRERWQARFGRSRVVSLGAAISTLLRAQAPLRLRVSREQQHHEMRTLTLFVGNNRLQLEQLGLHDTSSPEASPSGSQLTAVLLKPVSTMAMLGLIARGALGQLGDADGIEHFPCPELTVQPAFAFGKRALKVAFDGEVAWMRPPIVIRVLPTPLWLLKGPPQGDA